ncbi:MAG: hypothetical protein RL023_921 [Candidatus Parcubacteria bacterium]|jgi:hypothetical protein
MQLIHSIDPESTIPKLNQQELTNVVTILQQSFSNDIASLLCK